MYGQNSSRGLKKIRSDFVKLGEAMKASTGLLTVDEVIDMATEVVPSPLGPDTTSLTPNTHERYYR